MIRLVLTTTVILHFSNCLFSYLRLTPKSQLLSYTAMFFLVVILAVGLAYSNATTFRVPSVVNGRAQTEKRNSIAAVLPGDPIITGGLAQGAVTAVAIYSKVILARFALSWFPQLVNQFPILQPVFTVSTFSPQNLSSVTEPYLRVFRSVIPPIAGFDISALPAIFCLDILGQTAAAVGAEFPTGMKRGNKRIQGKPVEIRTDGKSMRSHFKTANHMVKG